MNGELVAHTGVIQFPMRKGWKRVHRFVVLPDFQGIGIGTRFITEIGEMYKNKGYKFNLTTTTPALTGALIRNKKWTLKRYGRESSGQDGYSRYTNNNLGHLKNSCSTNRVTYSFYLKD